MKRAIVCNEEFGVSLEEDIVHITFPQNILTDAEIHEWIVQNLQSDLKVLIIEASLGSSHLEYLGIRMALHIRLTPELGQTRFCQLIMISNDDLGLIIREDKAGIAILLCSEGTKLVTANSISIKTVLESSKPFLVDSPSAIRDKILAKIKLVPPQGSGRHSLANHWGAYRLDQIAGTNVLTSNESVNKKRKELYFKYLIGQQEELNIETAKKARLTGPKVVGKMALNDKVDCRGKQILIIDDEAEKGWTDILSSLCKNADITSIDTSLKHDRFMESARQHLGKRSWDLIFLDLRLDPKNEDTIDFINGAATMDYSGAKLLTQIKAINRGTQVIMLTASNKAWNMKELLDQGANGYYIKESPEIAHSYAFSHQNYKSLISDIKRCLSMRYLHTIWNCVQEIKLHSPQFDIIAPENLDIENKEGIRYWNEILKTLDSILPMLESKAGDKLNFTVLLLFRVLEVLGEWYFQQSREYPILSKIGVAKIHLIRNSKDKVYVEKEYNPGEELSDRDAYFSTRSKVQCICHQFLGIQNYTVLEDISALANQRNEFIHPKNRHAIASPESSEVKNWVETIKLILTSI